MNFSKNCLFTNKLSTKRAIVKKCHGPVIDMLLKNSIEILRRLLKIIMGGQESVVITYEGVSKIATEVRQQMKQKGVCEEKSFAYLTGEFLRI